MMSEFWKEFLQRTSPPLRLGFLGFLIAAIGAALGFSIDYRPGNAWAYIAFIVATGVAIGFFSVAWGWLYAFRTASERLRDRKQSRPAPVPHDPSVPSSGPGGL
jgi:hypothetical protein